MLNTIKEYHAPIADLFGTGVGVELMKTDSDIVDYIVSDHVERSIPILTVHDSFIVPYGQEAGLSRSMQTAFEWITKSANIDVKYYDEMLTGDFLGHVARYRFSDPDYYFSAMDALAEKTPPIERVKGYKERFAKHKSFFSDLYPDE